MRPTVQSKRRRREGDHNEYTPICSSSRLSKYYIPTRLQKLARFVHLTCAWSVSVSINQKRFVQQLPTRIWQRAGNTGRYHTPLSHSARTLEQSWWRWVWWRVWFLKKDLAFALTFYSLYIYFHLTHKYVSSVIASAQSRALRVSILFLFGPSRFSLLGSKRETTANSIHRLGIGRL